MSGDHPDWWENGDPDPRETTQTKKPGLFIVKKINKLGHSKAYLKLLNGKLKPIAWINVHEAIRNGVEVIIQQPDE